jgi:putative flippase GtrA
MVDEPAPPILRPGLRRDDRNGSLPSEFDVTVVIPTRNETGNVEELLRRLDAALGSLRAEVLFVDDSDDDTPSVIRDAADKSSRPVRLLHREPGRRAGRLGGAVVAGFQLARAPWAVVIDGDLQHPPEMIPSLIGRASPDVDLVYGTRYVDSGDAGGLNGRGREWVSAASTALAKAVFPRKLRAVSDPMSGFFAVRLGALDLSALGPAGYKVLLEILAQSRLRATAGVAYSFQPRFSGQSKASLIEGARFLVQLVALRLGMSVGRLAQIAAFLAVGLSGVAVNTLALWSLSAAWFDLPYLLAAFLATNIAIAWNFVLLETWVFRRVRRRSFAAGFVRFWLVNAVLLPVQLGLLAVLVEGPGVNPVVANVLTLVAVFFLRYLLTSMWVYGRNAAPADVLIAPPRRLFGRPMTGGERPGRITPHRGSWRDSGGGGRPVSSTDRRGYPTPAADAAGGRGPGGIPGCGGVVLAGAPRRRGGRVRPGGRVSGGCGDRGGASGPRAR